MDVKASTCGFGDAATSLLPLGQRIYRSVRLLVDGGRTKSTVSMTSSNSIFKPSQTIYDSGYLGFETSKSLLCIYIILVQALPVTQLDAA